MKFVSIRRSVDPLSCGIRSFSRHLHLAMESQSKLAVEDPITMEWRDINLASQPYESLELESRYDILLLHFVSSMWSNQAQLLQRLLDRLNPEQLIVVLHGIYPSDVSDPGLDALCPDLDHHVSIMESHSSHILGLSRSCIASLVSWIDESRLPPISVRLHPGAYITSNVSNRRPQREYAFLGGITRAKKHWQSPRTARLIESCRTWNLPIWLHDSNNAVRDDIPDVWRITHGFVSDREWTSMILGAKAVFCPYETKLQCASGIISEAVSLGRRVFATGFPYANELSKEFPEYVTVDDNTGAWPQLVMNNPRSPLPRPSYPTWNDLAQLVLSIAFDKR